MQTDRIEVINKAPGACSEAELEAFIGMVLEGGEVSSIGLPARVRQSAVISFVRRNGALLAVGALKRPTSAHREEVSIGAGIELTDAEYPFELGWIFVSPQARGLGLSKALCRSLVSSRGSEGIFSTTRTENVSMQSTLQRCGFIAAGVEYQSTRGNYALRAFLTT